MTLQNNDLMACHKFNRNLIYSKLNKPVKHGWCDSCVDRFKINGFTSNTPGLVASGRMVRMVVKMVKMIVRMVQMIILIVRIMVRMGKTPSILQYFDYISDLLILIQLCDWIVPEAMLKCYRGYSREKWKLLISYHNNQRIKRIIFWKLNHFWAELFETGVIVKTSKS